MAINNESIGISAEVAIGRTFDVPISPDYELRAEERIVALLMKNNAVAKIFYRENIPVPIAHIAERQNRIDFILAGNKTLSVKTNQNDIGRAAPQNIGQPTHHTYFEYLKNNNIIPGFDIENFLAERGLHDCYAARSEAFKYLSIGYIDRLINMYWKNMFECDYLILFYNLDSYQNPLDNYRIFGKMAVPPNWKRELFSFTQTVSSWNESNTVKYNGISIGNFQVHRNRYCFKFRFNMKGIVKLLDRGLI